MGALASKLLAQLQQLVAPLVGPLGIALITIGIAGAAIAVMLFSAHVNRLWYALLAGIVLLTAGAVAAGLA